MNQKFDPKTIAMRLSSLSEEKKIQFRALLTEKNIDSWQLPIVATSRTEGKEVLSNAQQRLWFIDHYEEGSTTYNLFSQITLRGELDINALKYALNAVLQRHEVLRTTYHMPINDVLMKNHQPMQQVESEFELPFWVKEHVDDIEQFSREAIETVFDLSTQLPLRIYLLPEQDGQWHLIFIVHHIAFDAWSEAILIKEIADYYQQFIFSNSSNVVLAEIIKPELQYADYAKWQQEWLKSEQAEKQLQYWKETLKESPECMDLPLDYERPDVMSRHYKGSEVQLTLPRDTYYKLMALAKEQSTTLYAVLQAGFSLLLNQYGAGTDISLGTSVASRQRPELEEMIGFLVNTLVIRHKMLDGLSFKELINQVSKTSQQAFENQAIPFDLVVDKLNISRGKPWSPLFQVLFVHRNVPREEMKLGDIDIITIPNQTQRSRFDLTIRLTEIADELRFDMEYSEELFNQQTIVEMLNQYSKLLTNYVEQPDLPITLVNIRKPRPQATDTLNNTIIKEVVNSSLEKELTMLFSDILECAVNVEDSFFKLGGDSILSLQLVAKAKKSGLLLTPKMLFKLQTPRAIASILTRESITNKNELVNVTTVPVGLIHLKAILSAFRQLLNMPNLTEQDSFFEHGGDSILSLQLVAQLKKENIKVTPKQVFVLQTAYGIAQALANNQTEKEPVSVSDKGEVKERYQLSPIQHWFFEQNVKYPSHFNQSILLRYDDLNLSYFNQAVQRVMNAHTQLHMNYIKDNDISCWQPSLAVSKIEVNRHVIEECDLLQYVAAQQSLLDINSKPLINVDLLEFKDQKQGRILLTTHHLVIDAVSWRILGNQIEDTYQMLCANNVLSLETKLSSDSYENWVNDLVNWPVKKLNQARDYWHQLAITDHKIQQKWVALPNVDLNKPVVNITKNIEMVEVRLSPKTTKKLISEALIPYQLKIDELILSAVMLAVAKWRGEGDFLIELESHGRHHDTLDLSQTVGWFTSRYPVLLSSNYLKLNAVSLREHILMIKDQLRLVPDYGQGFGVLKYLHNELQTLVTPTMVFNYLGQTNKGFTGSNISLANEAISNQRHPENTRTQWLDLNAMINNDELIMRWNFNSNMHKRSDIVNFTEQVVTLLNDIVTHCCEAQRILSCSDVSLSGVTQCQLDKLMESVPEKNTNIKDIYPISPLQNGMLYHTLAEENQGMYVNQSLVDLYGELDTSALEAAWQWTIDQHDMLRTGFLWQQLDDPVQYVVNKLKIDWETLNWIEKDNEQNNIDTQLSSLAEGDIKKGFDLVKAGLMKFKLVKLKDEHHCLIWTRHHLVVDGWCTSIILQDVQRAYFAISNKKVPQLINRPPYRDFIEWLGRRNNSESEDYWHKLLQGYNKAARLPKPLIESRLFQDISKLSSQQILTSVSERETDALKKLAAFYRITLNSLCQALWALTLQRYTRCDDLVFGVTSSGRPDELEGAQEIVGVFITTIPVRASIQQSESWAQLAQKLQNQMTESRDHEHVALSTIQRITNDQVAIFDNLLVFENYPVDKQPLSQALTLTVRETIEHNNYPLTMVIVPHQTLDLRMEINPEQFDKGIANDLLTDFSAMLSYIAREQVPSQEQEGISCATLINQSSLRLQDNLMSLWNNTQYIFDDVPDTLSHWLEQQATLRPNSIALICPTDQGYEEYTYEVLNQKASQLAHYLIDETNCQPDNVIAVCMTRSPQMVFCLLGILKAGCAYLPLDPDQPEKRLAFIIDNAGAKTIFTSDDCYQSLPTALRESSLILDDKLSLLSSYPTHSPKITSASDHLAYVLYTSGSTGQPKGVAIPHSGIVNRLAWMQKQYALTKDDKVLQKTPYSFDVSVWEFFWPLVVGAKLVLAEPEAHKNSQKLVTLINTYNVSIIHFVPSMLQSFLDNKNVQRCTTLNHVFCSGEALPYQLQQQAIDLLPAQLHNLYGPTEASIDVTYWDCRSQHINNVVPIGYPIANMQTWVLDDALNPVPIGVEGELYLAGVGLARGYLGRDDLTQKSFIVNPFFNENIKNDNHYSRLYRTGDVVRYRHDGAIEYIGRADFQVKIRGLRIELGEIDTRIAEHSSVKEVVTVVLNNASLGDYLATYVVPHSHAYGTLHDLEIWRAFLSEYLPAYMCPSIVIELEEMPLTPNGKLDRKALPSPTWQPHDFVAPETETQKILAELWQILLGVESVGKTDNFFTLGGHSLLITRLVNRVNDRFLLTISLKDVLTMPVLDQQAAYIDMLIHQTQSNKQENEEWESFEL